MKDKNGDDIVIGDVYTDGHHHHILVEENYSGFCKGLTYVEGPNGFHSNSLIPRTLLHVAPENAEFWKRCFADKVRYLKPDELQVGEIYQSVYATCENSIFEPSSECRGIYWDGRSQYVTEKGDLSFVKQSHVSHPILPASEDQIEQFNKLKESKTEAAKTEVKEEKPVVRGFNVLEKVTSVNAGDWVIQGTKGHEYAYKVMYDGPAVPAVWKLEPDLPEPVIKGYEFEYGQIKIGEKFVGSLWNKVATRTFDTFIRNGKHYNIGGWRWIVTKEFANPPNPPEPPKDSPKDGIKINGQLIKVGEPTEIHQMVYTLGENGELTVEPTATNTCGYVEPSYCCEQYDPELTKCLDEDECVVDHAVAEGEVEDSSVSELGATLYELIDALDKLQSANKPLADNPPTLVSRIIKKVFGFSLDNKKS